MKVRLTEAAITKTVRDAAETGRRIEISDISLPGLRLRITPSGRRSWVLGMRDAAGDARRYALGEHPVVGIADARDAARQMRAKIKAGAPDPIVEGKRRRGESRDARQGVGTLAALIDLYGVKKGVALKSWPEYRRAIGSVFADLMPRPLPQITVGDLQMAADAYRSAQSASSAVRCLRPILKWAAAPGRRYAAVELTAITTPAPVNRRKRVLTRDELEKVLPVLWAAATPYRAAMMLMLLTLCRREEAGRAIWADVDFRARTWLIPITKNGEPHTVPLSRQAISLLRLIEPPPPFVPEHLVFSTSNGTRLANWSKAGAAVLRETGTSGWTRHDLRRTGATLLGEMGETPDIIEAALNHLAIRSALATTYNRSRYRPAVADALQRLGDLLEGIKAGAAEIVPIGRGIA